MRRSFTYAGWRVALTLLALPWALSSVGGCAPARERPLESATEISLFWPPPPETARIQFLRTITTPEDLGMTKSFFRKVVEFFAGEADERMRQPYGIVVDAEERIYVADAARRVVHVFDRRGGRYRTIEGAGKLAFQYPLGLTLDGQGRLYVSDPELHAVFRLDLAEKEALTITTSLQRPAGLVFNPQTQLLYVVDTGRHEILAYDLDGTLKASLGGRGTDKGRFNFPTNIAVDRDGLLYITDSMNFRVQVLRPDGTFVQQFGRIGNAVGDFARPKGIGIDSAGHIYVVEGLYDAINIFDRQGQLLLTFGEPGRDPGQFWLATGLFIDARDRIYLADSFNSRIQVFQYLGNTNQ